MAVTVGRSLDEINSKVKELNSNIKATTEQNKLLDKSLQYDKDPLANLNKQAENLQSNIAATTEKLELLKQKQIQYESQLKSGEISQSQYNKLGTDIQKAEYQLTALNAQLEITNQKIKGFDLNQISSKLETVGTSITNIGNKLKIVSAAAAATLAGLVALGLKSVSTADDIQTLATQLGITAEQVQVLNYLAKQTDTDANSVAKAFVKVKNALGDISLGNATTATDSIEKLGITITDTSNASDAFYDIVEALSKVNDESVRTALATNIFGNSVATEILPFISAGSDKLAEYADEIQNIGITSNESIEALSDFDNTINEIKASFNQVILELGTALLPVMEELASFIETNIIPAIKGAVEWFGNLDTGTQKTIIGILAFIAAVAPVLIIIGKLTTGISSIISLIAKLGTVSMTTLAGVGGIVAACVLLAQVIANWTNMNTFQKIISVLGVLSVAALGAAIALGAFHSAWSLGLAVAGIVAGIVAVTAAVNSAAKAAGVAVDTSAALNASSQMESNANQSGTNAANGSNNTVTNNTDNATYNIYITNEAGDTSDDLLNKINKALLTKKLARS